MKDLKKEFLDAFKRQMAFDEPNMIITNVAINKETFVPEIKMHLENNEIELFDP